MAGDFLICAFWDEVSSSEENQIVADEDDWSIVTTISDLARIICAAAAKIRHRRGGEVVRH